MRFATIGTSWITESFISATKLVEGMEHFAVYSRSPEQAAAFAGRHNVSRIFTSLEEMADCPEIDAVYIASPNSYHYEQSRLFLNHGKSVLCEKSAAIYPAQTEELFEIADRNKLIYLEAIMSLHVPAFDILRNALNEIGNIYSVNLNYSQLSSKYPLFLDGKNPNIFNPEMCAGCLTDIGVYNIYIAAALFGYPEKITAVSHFLNTGADSCGSAILEYADKLVTLTYSKVGQSHSRSEFLGDKGTITVESVSQLTGIRLFSAVGERELVPSVVSRDIIMSGEAEYFCNAVMNKQIVNESYGFYHNTMLTVNRIMLEIRKQNNFRF